MFIGHVELVEDVAAMLFRWEVDGSRYHVDMHMAVRWRLATNTSHPSSEVL